VDACKLLTQAEIAKLVGEAVNPLKPSLPGDESSCATTDSSATGKFVSVSISVHSPASSQSMSLIRRQDARNAVAQPACCQVSATVTTAATVAQGAGSSVR
jgi:putative lipoic acid-binding regulatory protein